MAGGHRQLSVGGGHVAGGRAAGRGRVARRAPGPLCGPRTWRSGRWRASGAAVAAAVGRSRRARSYSGSAPHRRRRVRGVASAAGPAHVRRLRPATDPGHDRAARERARADSARELDRRGRRRRSVARRFARRGGHRLGDVRGPQRPRSATGARASGGVVQSVRAQGAAAAGDRRAGQRVVRGADGRADRRRRHEVGDSR